MTDNRRDPHSDNELIDEAEEASTPVQGGTSGGDLQREIGARDDQATGLGGDPQPASVHKSDKPEGGDEPNPPHRRKQGGEARVPPRRT